MSKRFFSFILIFFLFSKVILADDVGIAEVRLIEEENNTYSFEVDIPPSLLSTIQRPILPSRCSYLGDPEQSSVGPMRVVRYRFSSGDTPLQPDDELLLFWQRSGVVVTAYWMDGSSHRGFFDRELAGIRIPVSRLREIKITTELLLYRGLIDAVNHLGRFWFLHLLLVFACSMLAKPQDLAKLILSFAAGHGLSLVVSDLGVTAFQSGIVPILMGLASLMIFTAFAYKKGNEIRFWPVLMVLGLIHGLSYTRISFNQSVDLTLLQLITARLAFNTTIDIFQVLIAAGLGFMWIYLRRHKSIQYIHAGAVYVAGGLALSSLLVVLPSALSTSLPATNQINPSLSANTGPSSSTPASSRPVELSDPLQGFVTITPFEIRCEWLIRIEDLNTSTVKSETGELVIPIDGQSALKDELMQRFDTETLVSVDGLQLDASLMRADFVSVSNYGVTTRPAPVPESLEHAVIGLTMAFVLTEAPSHVSVKLFPYPEKITSIPLTFTDPWGSTSDLLTRESSTVNWKRRMAGFRRPTIRSVTLEPVTWPIVSTIMLLVSGLLAFFIRRGWHKNHGYAIIIMAFIIAMGTYPFIRVAVPSSLSRGIPAEERMEKAMHQLLVNIYRAFDYRTEEAIYDRLAISATGDQLALIYLQHRSAMEIENRGGARASVDDVEILEINDIRPLEGGLSLRASWMVSGSVNHFGHIHYRKNQYKALIQLVSQDGALKIKGIEVEMEERVL